MEAIPSYFDGRKSAVEDGLRDFFGEIDGRKTIYNYELMLDLIVGDASFEEKYKQSHEMIESIYDIPW